VAKVETQHTFLNQLVGFLTLGIYTPMQIRVTCATAASASRDPAALRVVATGSGETARRAALARAVSQSAAEKKAVYLEF
jgi:hypothetical protein